MKKFCNSNLVFPVLIIFLLLPGNLYGESSEQPEGELLQQFRLIVSGLKCKSCIPDVRKSLRGVPGVRDARVTEFHKAGSTTLVEVVPGVVGQEQIIAALNAAGFRVEIISVGDPRRVLLKEDSGYWFFGLFD